MRPTLPVRPLSIAALGIGLIFLLTVRTDTPDPEPDPVTETAFVQLRAGSSAHFSRPDTSLVSSGGTQVVAPLPDGYWSDRVVVRVDGDALRDVADRHGLQVRSGPGRSGLASVSVPDGESAAQVLDRLRRDPDVRSARAAARMVGTGKGGKKTAASLAWHSEAVEQSGAPDGTGWTVAVLDSGAAYEDWEDLSGTYVATEALRMTPVVAPWDFVNGDAHANDDHQHGSHIAAVVLGGGLLPGIAPGATLMPLKVLDENNAGDELGLTEAIHHAVDNGADVLNMSLSFGEGYVPSMELLDAIERADDAGVVMVAAAGNTGADRISWPAAHPEVIAVAASTPTSDKSLGWPEYTNLGRVDVIAPGGDITADLNLDGYADGILAETIAPNEPTDLGYWFYAGTSQAAAVVSGAAVQLLAAGAAPEDVVRAIHKSAKAKDGPWIDGNGAGDLSIAKAVAKVDGGLPESPNYAVSVLAILRDAGNGIVLPEARLQVTEASGAPVVNHSVFGAHWGSKPGRFECTTDLEGMCVVTLDEAADDGLWIWEVEVVSESGIGARPEAALYVSEELEVLLAAIAADPELAADPLAVYWPAGSYDELGDVVEHYTVPNLGTGLLSSPMGIAFTPKVMSAWTVREVDVDLDGTGLLSSPMGTARVRSLTVDFSGSGLLSSPMGRAQFRMVALDGSGLLSSPMGYSGLTLFRSTTFGTGLLSSPMGSAGSVLRMRSGRTDFGSLAGTAIGEAIDAGGWTFNGLPAAIAVDVTGIAASLDEELPPDLDGSSNGPGQAWLDPIGVDFTE